jgi:hypothetical protein
VTEVRRIKGGESYSYDPDYPFLAPGTECKIINTFYESSKWRRINHKCHEVRFDGVGETFIMYDEELSK